MSNLKSLHQIQEYAQLGGPRTTKHGLHHVWETPEKQSGQIGQDECAGRTHEPLYAPLSPTAPGQVIVFVLANTIASEKNGTTTMTRVGFVVYDINLTDFQTVVQIYISSHIRFSLLTLALNLT